MRLLLLITFFLMAAAHGVPPQYCPSVGYYADSTDDCGTGTEDCCPADLTVAKFSAIDATTAEGSVTTNKGSGTMYACVKPSGQNAPGAADVIAGTGCTETSSKTVSAAGAISFTGADNFSGLTAFTSYITYYAHDWDDRPASEVRASGVWTTLASGGGGPTVTGYFVAGGTSGVDCDDTWNGTAALPGGGSIGPWCTAQKAEDTVTATSSKVYFRGNATHNLSGQFLVGWTGTSGDHAVLGCYVMDGATAEACETTTRAKLATQFIDEPNGIVRLTSKNYVEINNIEIDPDHENWTDTNGGNPHGEYRGIYLDNADYIEIRNFKMYPLATQANLEATRGWDERWTAIRTNGSSDFGQVINPDIRYWGDFGMVIAGQDWQVFRESGSPVGIIKSGYKDPIRVGGGTESRGIQVYGASWDYMLELGNSLQEEAITQVANNVVDGHITDDFMFKFVYANGYTAENCLDLKNARNWIIEKSICGGLVGDNSGKYDGYAKGGKSAVNLGSGNTAYHGIARQFITLDGGSMWPFNDYRFYNITQIHNNRYWDSADAQDNPGSKPDHVGMYWGGGTVNNGVFMNSTAGNNNSAEVAFPSWWNGYIDYNLYFETRGGQPKFASPPNQLSHDWPNNVTDFAAYKTVIAAHDNLLGDDVNSYTATTMPFVSVPNQPNSEQVFSGNYDFNPAGGSDLIANAGPLTTTTNSSGGGTSVNVVDACMFWDNKKEAGGAWINTTLIPADYIIIGAGAAVQIANRDCDTNAISLSASRAWNNGDGVWWADSAGNKIDDIGACPATNSWCG